MLGVLSAVALPRFVMSKDEAENAIVDSVYGALISGEKLVRTSYYLQGSPGKGVNTNVTVTINNIPVRFRNGQIYYST